MQRTHDVMNAFGLRPEEVDALRRGELPATLRRRLRRTHLTGFIGFAAIVVVGGMAAVAAAPSLPPNEYLITGVALMLFGVALATFFFNQSRDASRGVVERASGTLTRKYWNTDGASDITIGRARYILNRLSAFRLLDEGRTYIIYYLPRTREVIYAERAD
ncbi:MAG: hypothetical protein HC828_19215 [Blastochloris sp.]|nr:hypothetical protein [Blastochloris sp.]